MISDFAEGHADQLDNLILLAAYPGKKIPDGISLSSIYGTRDGCLNRAAYEEAKAFWPEDSSESQLEGGNHAQFADYGPQSGDLEAEISPEEKQNKTVEIILEAIDMFY